MTHTASSLLHSDLLIPTVLGAVTALTAHQLLRRPRTRRFLLLLTAATAMVIATGCLVTTHDAALLVSSVVLAELARAILATCPRSRPTADEHAAGRLTVHPPTTASAIAITVLITDRGHTISILFKK